GCGAVRVAVGVGDGDQFHAVGLAEHAGVVPAHHAQPDQSGPEHGFPGPCHAQAPAFARALTAVTIRSRSSASSEGCTGSESTSAAAASVTGRSAAMSKEGSRWFGIG